MLATQCRILGTRVSTVWVHKILPAIDQSTAYAHRNQLVPLTLGYGDVRSKNRTHLLVRFMLG